MGRRGGSIYIATDPTNLPLSIGTPGVGVSIGPLGPTIYAGTGTVPAAALLLENGDALILENGDFLITE